MNIPTSLQKVMDYFRRAGWNFQTDPNRPILLTGAKGRNGSFRCVVTEDESDDLLQFFSCLPLAVPPHKRAAIGELCLRLSFSLKVGNFEMNPSDGEVRFHTYSAHDKGQLSDDVIKRVIGINLIMMDQHLPAFAAVLFSDSSAEEAASSLRPGALAKKEPRSTAKFESPSRLSLN